MYIKINAFKGAFKKSLVLNNIKNLKSQILKYVLDR